MSDYPKTERAALVNSDQIEAYLGALFQNLPFTASQFVNVRGIGEKGTDREGSFQEDCWSQPGLVVADVGAARVDGDEALAMDVAGWCRTWAQHNVAAYIVPAVLKEARGRAEAVELFPAVMVDLDSGDTHEKAVFLGEHLGEPSIVVKSGGTTDAGTPKLHLYWVLDEPSNEIGRVVDLRHDIARKVGGDLQFGRGIDGNPYGRAHQPIRIPGSVHAKSDKPQPVKLAHSSGPSYDIDILAESVRRMPDSPWAIASVSAAARAASGALTFDFGVDRNHRPDIATALTSQVHEGGEATNRWGEFNRVAGYHVGLARESHITLDEARERTAGWVSANMVPPWPEARVQREFQAIVNRDVAKKGAMPASVVDTAPKTIVKDVTRGLREWAVSGWTKGAPPKREFLVEGLLLAKKPHLLVAEGGAGKTFAMLELCLKVAHGEWDDAAGARTDGLQWLGQKVLAKPGTVVMLTTEDDADELHIRFDAIDPGGVRHHAGERLIVVPAVNTARGPFTFGQRDKMTGNVTASEGWREFRDWLAALPDLRLVVVDTLNTTLHGEENSATVVNEYAKLLAPVCGELGAALVVTHHIRKQDSKFPIKTVADMMNAVRGSSALPAAFRAVLGLWHAHDFGKLMQAMGLAPKMGSLWRMGVLKANNPEMMPGVGYLLRSEAGGLDGVTERVHASMSSDEAQRRAWLVAAVRCAAEAGVPYKHVTKDGAQGLSGRKNELHPLIRTGWRTSSGSKATSRMDALVAQMIDGGELAVCTAVEWADPSGRLKRFTTLDVAGGVYDRALPPRVEFGVAYSAPEWEREWAFNPATGEAGPKAQQFTMAGL